MNQNDEELMSEILQEEERLRQEKILRLEEEERLRKEEILRLEEEERLRREVRREEEEILSEEEEEILRREENIRSKYNIRKQMMLNKLAQNDSDREKREKIYEPPRVFVPSYKDGNMKVNLNHRSRTIQTTKKSANKSKRKKKSKKRKSPKKH